jgi:DNA-binding transcriptional LysR family regulator
MAGLGVMLKSEVDVAEDLVAGRLERVLPEWGGSEALVIALYPSAQHVPLKTRALLTPSICTKQRGAIAGGGPKRSPRP